MPITLPQCSGQAASGRHSHSSCDRSPIHHLWSLLRHPQTLWRHGGPVAQDKTGSSLFLSLFCQLRPSGLYLIIRMAPGPPPAREGVRCRHGPLEEGCPSPAAGVPDPPSRGPGPPRVSRTSWCARLHSVQGVQDRCVPRPRWCTQDFDLRGPQNATTPHMEDHTPNSDNHAICRDWQDTGAISAGPRTISRTTATPDAMPRSVLPTVFDHCNPRFGGKRRLPRPHSCAPPLLVTIKGEGGLPLSL